MYSPGELKYCIFRAASSHSVGTYVSLAQLCFKGCKQNKRGMKQHSKFPQMLAESMHILYVFSYLEGSGVFAKSLGH